jgi:hypothetical protein
MEFFINSNKDANLIMTTYKELKGTNIEAVSSDPSNPVIGQVWYNSTDQVVKGEAVATSGSWSTTNSLNTPRGGGGAGFQTAALYFAGYQSKTETEAYNGSNWTELNDLNAGRDSVGGAGTQTSALCNGGYDNGGPLAPESYMTRNELWNGTNWTEVNNLNTGRQLQGSAGADNTSSLVYGGLDNSPAPAYTVNTESWNGTNWTEVNNLNTGRYSQGCGTVTSALNFGGYTGSNTANTELWNGTNWTEVNNLNTSRRNPGTAGTDSTNALAFGGTTTTSVANTEEWNGTNWTEVNDMLAAVAGSSKNIGTRDFALGASTPTGTQEWSKTTSVGAWATGGSLNTARGFGSSAGTYTAGLYYGGTPTANNSTYSAAAESYNGTNWTEVNDLNTARLAGGGVGATNTAALMYGGTTGSNTGATENYNGSWTEVNDLNTARHGMASVGANNTAALAVGGSGGPGSNEQWNGSNWTEVNDTNTTAHTAAGAGTTSAGMIFGGDRSGTSGKTELWNGTNWTEVNDLNTARTNIAGSGLQTAALAFAGFVPPRTTLTEKWNGTNWTEVADLSTARYDTTAVGAGTTANNLAIGGNAAPGQTDATEEWTGTAPTTVTFANS